MTSWCVARDMTAPQRVGRRVPARPPLPALGLPLPALQSHSSRGSRVPLAALEAKIDEVVEACGFDHDASMTTLQKLALLEVCPAVTPSSAGFFTVSNACRIEHTDHSERLL